MIGETSRLEICWTTRGIIALQSLQVSCLSVMHSRFYESSKLKSGCVNYACFHKCGRIFCYIETSLCSSAVLNFKCVSEIKDVFS